MRDLQQLASAVLCVGFEGTAPDSLPAQELRALAPGGLVLFSRNVTDAATTRVLCSAAREAAGGDSPAFVAVDQEGGRVARLVDGATKLPSMMALGATGDADLARRAGRVLASDLHNFGASVDFAPVLDLALDPANTMNGTRSLGSDPVAVAKLGVAFIESLQAAGIGAAAKHFPGHGGTAVDSHIDLPSLDIDSATLHHRELVPFAAAIEAGVKAIMAAHIVVRAIDPGVPATLSPLVLTGLLRDELDFEGVCFTDSMEMGAIANTVGIVPAIVRAIAAGADCALVCHSLQTARNARDAIVAAVQSGHLKRSRLEEAAARVDRLRAWCARQEPGALADAGIAGAIAAKAIRVVRGAPSVDAQRPVTVISFEGDDRSGAEDRADDRPSLSLALRRRRIRSEQMRVPLDPPDAMLAHLREVLSLEGRPQLVLVMRRAHLYPRQRRAIEMLLDADADAIVVSALEPFDVPSVPDARHVVCIFGDQEPNIEAVADRLTGG